MPVNQNFPGIAQDHINLMKAEYYKIDKETKIRNEATFFSAIQTNHQEDTILFLDVLRLKLNAFLEDALHI